MGSVLQEDHISFENTNGNINNLENENLTNDIQQQLKTIKNNVKSKNETEKNNVKKNEVQKRIKKEKEELEKLIFERTKDYVKLINAQYNNSCRKYYGSINENNNIFQDNKSRNIDLYDNIDEEKKDKILKFWEKRRVYKLIDDIIQELIDYTVHSHYYNKNFDKLNFNNNTSLYQHWDIKNKLTKIEDNLNNIHNDFKTNIWVKNAKESESVNSAFSSLFLLNSQELSKNSIDNKLKNKYSSNYALKQIPSFPKQDERLSFLYNASTINVDDIEKEYENKVNDISSKINKKLEEIVDTENFISASWDALKQCNISNTMKIINYYGPIYYNLSWPTEYVIPEFDEDIQKKQNLIYWTNDQIKNMIYTDISNMENGLMHNNNNIFENYKDIYGPKKNNNTINNKLTRNIVSTKRNKVIQNYPKYNSQKDRMYESKNSLSSTFQTLSSIANKKGMVAIPSNIRFDKFVPYKSYSSILIIKNTTYETQRIQVVIESEENSKYFRICKIYSPGDNGLISPGLSAHYKVIFNPVSLKTCYGTINVTSSYGDKLIINILAKIKEPKIDIPLILNCNPCIVNSMSETDVIIKNSGGKGKFIIIDHDDKRSCEELHDIKLNHDYSKYIYHNGPFKIVPGYCEINENEKIKLKVYFEPKYNLNFRKENKKLNYIEELKVFLAWDNCEKQEITIKGNAQEPCISIENNEELIEKKTYRDICTDEEIIYSNIVEFDTCNINSEITKIIRLKNMTDVNIPIKWNIIDKPKEIINSYNDCNDLLMENLESKDKENHSQKYSYLSIKDNSNEITTVTTSSCNFDNNKIYNCNNSNTKIPSYNVGKKVLKVYPEETVFKPREVIEFKFSFCPKNYKHYDIIAQLLYNKDLNFIEDDINDNELINIRCIGKSEPLKIEVVPAILNIPEKLNVDEKYIKEISIYNNGKASISFTSILTNNTPEIAKMKISNSNGIIEPGSSTKIFLSVKGYFSGNFNGNIEVYFNNNKFNTINININGEFNFKSGNFVFDKKIIDFGIIQLGSCAKEYLLFTNNSEKKINWNINLYTKNKEKCDYLALFEPKRGYLESKESVKIDIIFIPLWYQQFKGEIICELINEKCENKEDLIQNDEFVISPQKYFSHSIRLIANVLTPKVIFQNNNKKENCVCYLNIEKEMYVTLKNITLLPTHYKIFSISNKDISIRFDNEEGIINGNEEIDVKFYVKGKTIGNFDDIEINAIIDGMVENYGNLSVKLNLDIKGLDIDIEIYNSKEDFDNKLIDKSGCLNYGSECQLFKSYKKIIRIINTFQVESKYEISLGKYNINYDALSDDTIKNNSENLILKQKNNKKFYFYSKNGQCYLKNKIFKKENIENLKKLIFDKYGAGFEISSRSGILKPYDVVDIEITAYSNISGIYEDNLTIKVSNGIEKTIPVKMEVKGVPLTYINMPTSKDYNDIKNLFFSTRLVSSNVDFNENNCIDIPDAQNSVTKTICILNESPKDVTLSWELLINKTKINKYYEFKSIISKNNELVNMSLELLGKITKVSPEVLEVKQALEEGVINNENSTSSLENIPVLSVNSLYDENQTSICNINYVYNKNNNIESISNNNTTDNNDDSSLNKSQNSIINDMNKNINDNNSEENKSLESKEVSILSLDDYGNSPYEIKENIVESMEDIEKKKLIEEMNKFAKSYKYNTYNVFNIEPKTATIKSNEKVSFKINMKSSFEGIFDALLYSRLSYCKSLEDNENTENQCINDDIRDIIKDESITKLHLFGIITIPRIKFEQNLDYYHINLKYSNIDSLKTFNIINPSENIYIFKMIPSNNNIILGYTNNFYIDGLISNNSIENDIRKSVIIDSDTIIQLKAYENKIITVKLDKNLTNEEYNLMKNTDLKIKIEFINGVYQVIPITLQ